MIHTILAISSVVWVVVVRDTEGGYMDNKPTHACMDHIELEGEDMLKDTCVCTTGSVMEARALNRLIASVEVWLKKRRRARVPVMKVEVMTWPAGSGGVGC